MLLEEPSRKRPSNVLDVYKGFKLDVYKGLMHAKICTSILQNGSPDGIYC